MKIDYCFNDHLEEDEVVALYQANEWSSANKPRELLCALRSSHSLVTARHDSQLVGLANAISDGYLVVYYPHLLVLPTYQRQGIGREIMKLIQSKYTHFHQQTLLADGDALKFYEAMGFVRAGRTEPMWIYDGDDH